MQKRGGDDCFISNLSSLEPHRRAMHAENCNYNKGGGLMISALVHGSSGPGLSPGWGHCVVLCCWARQFILTVPLPTQEYKWVPANCWGNLTNCREVTCDGLEFHPAGVVRHIPATSCYEPVWLLGFTF